MEEILQKYSKKYCKNIPKTFQKLRKFAKIFWKHCENILKILQKFCKNIPKILHKCPQNFAKISQNFCENITNYCENIAKYNPKILRKICEIIAKIFRKSCGKYYETIMEILWKYYEINEKLRIGGWKKKKLEEIQNVTAISHRGLRNDFLTVSLSRSLTNCFFFFIRQFSIFR